MTLFDAIMQHTGSSNSALAVYPIAEAANSGHLIAISDRGI
jgi:hypothetical protein